VPRPTALAVGGGRVATAHPVRFDRRSPAWSPDGARLAYASCRAAVATQRCVIATVAANGADVRELFVGAADGITWSRTGTLAFTRPSGPAGVWAVNEDGSNLRRLVDGGGPAWSHDGQRLGFIRAGAIWIADADGLHERRLTTGAAGWRVLAWAPDGSRLVATGGNSGEALTIVDAESGAQTPLPVRSDWDCCEDHGSVAWSRDGGSIAFTTSDPGGTRVRVLDVSTGREGGWLWSAEASESLEISSLSWSPDGSRLAFSAGAREHALYVVAVDGPGRQRVPALRLPPESTVVVRHSRTGRRQVEFTLRAAVGRLAVSSSHVAAAHGSRLYVRDLRREAEPRVFAVHGAATDLGMTGGTVVYRIGRAIRALNARTGARPLVAVAGRLPIGLSVEGRRVLWVENRAARARIRVAGF
jgi:dipeptidyl aminopeptidase/acylaminoacyl peptidase